MPLSRSQYAVAQRSFLGVQGDLLHRAPFLHLESEYPALGQLVELVSKHGNQELLSPLRLFPADTMAPFRFVAQMKKLRREYGLTKPLKLALSRLQELLSLRPSPR